MCSLGDVYQTYCRPGQREIDGRGFIQLCRDCGLSDEGFTDGDAERIFLKAMRVASRRIDFPRFQDALRAVAERRGLEEDAVHRMLIAQCNRRPTMKRHESEPALSKHRGELLIESEADGVGDASASKRRHRRHLPSSRRKPKKLEVPHQDPPSCSSTPGGAGVGTLGGFGSGDSRPTSPLGPARPLSPTSPSEPDSEASVPKVLQMPSVSPTHVMLWSGSHKMQEPEPMPSPCSGNLPSDSKVQADETIYTKLARIEVPPPTARTQGAAQPTQEPEPLPSPCRAGLPVDLKEPEPLPSPCRGSLQIDIKEANGQEGNEGPELLSPTTSRVVRLPANMLGSATRPHSLIMRPPSPTASSAAVARGRSGSLPEDEKSTRNSIPTLKLGESALGDSAKAPKSPKSGTDGLEMVEDAFQAFCGEHQGMDANGFVQLCKQCCLIDRNFTAQDARLVFAEAVPVSLQRMDLRNFEAALARVAAQKGLDRGLVRRMVAFQEAAPSSHPKHQDKADKGVVDPLLPMMPAAAPALAAQEPPAPPPTISRSLSRLRGLRRSETMPGSLGTKEKQRPARLEAVQPGDHTDARGRHLQAATRPQQPSSGAREEPAPPPPPPPALPAAVAEDKGAVGAEGAPAEASGEGGSNPAAPPAPSTAEAGDGSAMQQHPASGEATADPSSKTFWPNLPLDAMPTGQTCHIMPLICAR